MSRHVKHASTPVGEIAYEERGEGPPALFVHGVFLNGHLWRHVIDRVADVRRCIAVDLLAHGETRTPPGQALDFTTQADMLESLCDELGLGPVDVVGNDSGAAIAQILAARHPERIRTLTITNGDVHDNWPPEAFQPTLETMTDGDAARALGERMLGDVDFAREALGVGLEHPERLSEETIRTYLEPLATDEGAANIERWMRAMDNRHTTEIEPALRRLEAPTLIVWGTNDVFFDVRWAHWLRDAIPGAREVVEVEGGKLFFPEERPDELAGPLRELWGADAA